MDGAVMKQPTGATLPRMFSISSICTPLMSKYTQEIVHCYSFQSYNCRIALTWRSIGVISRSFHLNERIKDGIVYIDDFFGNFMAGKLMANLPTKTMEDVEVLFIRLIKLGGYTDTLTYHQCRTIVHTVLNFTHPDIFDSSDNDSIINAFSR